MAKSSSSEDIEFHPDAMQRFERAVAVVSKSPPQHRVKEKPKANKAKKSRKSTKAT